MWYCEVRPIYSFLKKAGQFKKLDAHFHTVQLFELSSRAKSDGSESVNDAKDCPALRHCEKSDGLESVNNAKDCPASWSSAKHFAGPFWKYQWHKGLFQLSGFALRASQSCEKPDGSESVNDAKDCLASWNFFKKWIIWSGFSIMLHTDPMGKNGSRSNGKVVKGVHPIIYVMKSRVFWTLCFL